MLARVDAVDADIAAVDTQIGQHLAPFADAVARLDEIPGIGPTAAAIIIAEIGLDMTRFPTPAHLASWAKFAPGINSSAGKTKGNGSTGHGNRYLARVLGEAVAGAGRTDTFLGARYRRLVRRRGKKKAIVAVGRSLLVIIWHLLADPDTRFHDLGADHYDRHVNTHAKTTQPHPTARSTRLPRHPRTRRLTVTPEARQPAWSGSIFGLVAQRPFTVRSGRRAGPTPLPAAGLGSHVRSGRRRRSKVGDGSASAEEVDRASGESEPAAGEGARGASPVRPRLLRSTAT